MPRSLGVNARVTSVFASAISAFGFSQSVLASQSRMNGSFGCDYVGHFPAAQDLGRLRMNRLRRR